MSVIFHGERDDLISYADLSDYFGVVEGSLNDTDGKDKWLSFILDGKELLVSKVPIRNNVSWDHLYSLGLVYGTDDDGMLLSWSTTPTNQLRTITLNGEIYKVRLIKGLTVDVLPVDMDGLVNYYRTVYGQYNTIDNSEWSRLFYPIVTDDPNMVIHVAPRLANYSMDDLQMSWEMNRGSATWCQEGAVSTVTNYRILRGYDGPSILSWSDCSGVRADYGWRPVLEIIV